MDDNTFYLTGVMIAVVGLFALVTSGTEADAIRALRECEQKAEVNANLMLEAADSLDECGEKLLNYQKNSDEQPKKQSSSYKNLNKSELIQPWKSWPEMKAVRFLPDSSR